MQSVHLATYGNGYGSGNNGENSNVNDEYNIPLRCLFIHIFLYFPSMWYEWRGTFFFATAFRWCWRHARWLHGLSTKTYIYLYRTARWWQWLHVACLDPLTNKFYFKSIEWIRLEVIVSAHLHFHHRLSVGNEMPCWQKKKHNTTLVFS